MTRNYNPSKRILVTGGPGFLGSHLIDAGLAKTIAYFDALLAEQSDARHA